MDNPIPAGPSDAVFPPREASQQARSIAPITAITRPYDVIFAVLAALLVLLGIFILYSGTVSTNARIRRAESSIAEVTAIINREPLAGVGRQADQLVAVVDGYDKVITAQHDFTRLLDDIAVRVPSEVKMLSMSADSKGQFRSTLRAKSFIAAGKAILGLRQAKHLKTVTLETISFDPKTSADIDFSILATVELSMLQGTEGTTFDQTLKPNLFAPDNIKSQ